MNMICKASCSDWFTAGRVYPAAMENPTFMISAITGDDMVSDLTVTDLTGLFQLTDIKRCLSLFAALHLSFPAYSG
uniref:Uncharacterized protein n=1 Tax=Vibrio phage Vc1 TaxID=1480731 RepID=A0A6M5CAV9_9CAUD